MKFVTRILAPAVVIVTLGWATACAQSGPAARDPGLAAVQAMAEENYGGDEAGAAVMVLEGDGPAWAEGFGLADMENGVANTASTSFRIGSISKPFTAVAVLRLVEAGEVELDAPIGRYLADLPGILGQPTVRQILSHTSGLPDHFALPQVATIFRNPIEPDGIIALMAEAEFQFEPSTRWAYSNFNYVLLGRLIEALDPQGRDYGQYIEDEIFAPLGMVNSHYDRQAAIIPRRAHGYDRDDHGPVNTVTADPSLAYAAGALMSSAEDMGLFSRALIDHRLLSEAMLDLAWTAVILPDGEDTGYGLGFNVGRFMGQRVIWHNGSTNGFQAAWLNLPESGRTVAVLSNGYYRPNTTMMARRMLATLAGEPVPVFTPHPIDDAAWRPLEGRYELSDGRIVQIHVQDGVRYNIDGGGWNELAWGGDDLFYLEDSLSHIRVQRDAAGAITGILRFTGSLDRIEGRRIDGAIEGAQVSVPLDPDVAASLAGRWAMQSGDMVVITFDGQTLSLQIPQQPFQQLHAAADGSYFMRSAPVSIVFSEDGLSADLNLYGWNYPLTRS
tara:strand:+ start:15119 stop:16789 length:1671 start_codon:yes stop_codon:yes gene_type:complete